MENNPMANAAIAGGIVGAIATAIISSVITYKAYPKIKESIDNHESAIDILKKNWKSVAAVAAPVVATGAMVVATDVIGKQRASELKESVDKLSDGLKKSTTMYKNLNTAVANNADSETKDKIILESNQRDGACISRIMHVDDQKAFETRMFYDPLSKMLFTSSRAEIETAILGVNKKMNLGDKDLGCNAMYRDFCNALGYEPDEKYKNCSWSPKLAEANHMMSWLNVDFEKYNGDGNILGFDLGQDPATIIFTGFRGVERTPVEWIPAEDPTSEEWLCLE